MKEQSLWKFPREVRRVWRERRRKEWSLGATAAGHEVGVLETSEEQFQGSGVANQPESRQELPRHG